MLDAAQDHGKELEAALHARDTELREATEALEALEEALGSRTPHREPASPPAFSAALAQGAGSPASSFRQLNRQGSATIATMVGRESMGGDDDEATGFGGTPGGDWTASDEVVSADPPARSAHDERYTRFVGLANARKLALASQGFEVENVFINDLFDLAESADVDPEGWHDFLRDEMVSEWRSKSVPSHPSALTAANVPCSILRLSSLSRRIKVAISSRWSHESKKRLRALRPPPRMLLGAPCAPRRARRAGRARGRRPQRVRRSERPSRSGS